MAATSEGEDDSFWPGYVDALTAMVKVLTLIMMLLGIVVFSLSQNISRIILLRVAQAAGVTAEAGESTETIAERVIEAVKLRKPPVEVAANEPSPPTKGPAVGDDGLGTSLFRGASQQAAAAPSVASVGSSQTLDRGTFPNPPGTTAAVPIGLSKPANEPEATRSATAAERPTEIAVAPSTTAHPLPATVPIATPAPAPVAAATPGPTPTPSPAPTAVATSGPAAPAPTAAGPGGMAAGSQAAGERGGGDRDQGTESAGTKASGEGAGEQASGTREAGNRAAGTESSGEQASGERAAGTRAAGIRASGELASGEQSSGEQAGGTQSAGPRAAGDLGPGLARFAAAAPVEAPPLAASRQHDATIVSSRPPDLTAPLAGATLDDARATISIRFRDQAQRLDDESAARLKSEVAGNDAFAGARIVEVRGQAAIADGAVTDARRLAYQRVLVVRNELVAAGIPGDRLRLRVEDTLSNDGANLVRITAAR